MIKPNWILQRAALSPDKIALINVHTDEQWTYRKLKSEILQWIALFRKKNLNKGDRIAVLARNSPELFPIIFACGLEGFIYVPLNFRLSETEINELLMDSGAAILLYGKQLEKQIESVPFQPKVNLHINNTEQMKPALHVNRSDPWFMIYTGGTTGKPKGVVLSHEAVNVNAMNTIVSWGITEIDKTINYMPLFHTGGINALSIPILMAGGTVIIGDAFDSEEALRATDTYKATISLFVPTMYQSMVHHPYFQTSTFPSMNVFLSGGAPCPPNIYHHFHEKKLHFKEGYGLTEAGPNNFFIRSEQAQVKIGSVGKSMLLNEVMIVKEDGTPCRSGEVGELYVKGNHLFSYYWNQRKETEVNFVGEWFKTGDLAKFDEDGDYYIVGRKKDMIITGGENVYPQEVEQCLLNHEHINEVAVIGIPDEKWGERVVAFITVYHQQHYDEEAVRNYCKKYLGNYKIPKDFFILDEIPKTDVGKIDKSKLAKRLLKEAGK
ncbi:class I adenylate-forming enzyme family protein [Pseudogracilibacillus auburnensis]|uniref:Fatty-acyl-CoA synthase n=1 Tax=Pseudogracilibacillus auburnensis TaxID=1494959 RepID=A0A2V3W8F5_9BACI|nr:AMP-binding protein [Pseudogracilibacillus auburnensis]PXW90310.1 fatty-acyl-CoA synthase [Pseudogracilibacillus auburnensis]